MERVNKSILTFDELLAKKDGYKNLFSKEILDYLEALLNLEISAFKKELKDDTNDKKQLMELRFYKNLVAYNIYHRIQKLYSGDKYILDNLYSEAIVKYILGENDLLDLLKLKIDNDGKTKIIMYNPTAIKTLDELNVDLEHRKEDLYRIISFRIEDSNDRTDLENYMLYEKLSKMTKEDLVAIINSLKESNSIQRSFTSLVLQDFGLSIERDFKNEKKELVFNEGVPAQVLIKRKDDRNLFR